MTDSNIPHTGHVSRRDFLKSSSAALALAAIPGYRYLLSGRKKTKKDDPLILYG